MKREKKPEECIGNLSKVDKTKIIRIVSKCIKLHKTINRMKKKTPTTTTATER